MDRKFLTIANWVVIVFAFQGRQARVDHNTSLVTSMAAGIDYLDLDSQQTETSPLLMAPPSSVEHEHVVNICPTSDPFVPSAAAVDTEAIFRSSSPQSLAHQEEPPSGSSWLQLQSSRHCKIDNFVIR